MLSVPNVQPTNDAIRKTRRERRINVLLGEIYKRSDEAGRPVDVEIWRDERSGKMTMLRIITYYHVDGAVRKFRSDYPNDGSQEFKEALQKEIIALQEYMWLLDLLKEEVELASIPSAVEKIKRKRNRNWRD